MADEQPLTCVRCWHAHASRLLVIRWRSEQNLRLLCLECAAKDEADAPGLPGFRDVTVLAVGPVSGAVTEWGIRQPVSPGRDEFVVPYDPGLGENYARAIFPLDERHNPGAELVRREVTPWRLADEPATGEGRGDG
jgi:hypothetical protein